MSNALKKITTRAKQLKKKKPNSKWTSLVKEAGREYRAGKLGGVKKKKAYQTGSSNKAIDRKRKAKRPGKRSTYTERRANRSDMPNKLTGMRTEVKEKLSKALLDYELANTVKATKEAQARKVKYRRLLKYL